MRWRLIKEQDHKQELQRMDKSLELEVEKLSVDADLEKKKKEVSVGISVSNVLSVSHYKQPHLYSHVCVLWILH